MKKIIRFIKNNMLGFLVGISLCLNGVIIAETMLSSEQVSYSGSKTEQTTVKGTLDQLFDAVDINERLGNTDISSIGNGTVTGAISNVNNTVSELNNKISNYVTPDKTTIDIYGTISWDTTTGMLGVIAFTHYDLTGVNINRVDVLNTGDLSDISWHVINGSLYVDSKTPWKGNESWVGRLCKINITFP